MNVKLLAAAGALLLLVGITYFAMSSRDAALAPEDDSDALALLSPIDRTTITGLRIVRPAPTEEGAQDAEAPRAIALQRTGETWELTEPVQAPANQTAIDSALDALAELQATRVLSESAALHERMELDDAHALRVSVERSDGEPLTLLIGAFRSQQTAVRLPDSDIALGVEVSLRRPFDKAADDWRDKRIVTARATEITDVEYQHGDLHYRFSRNDEGDWIQAPLNGGQAEIERFSSTRVQSLVSTLAGLQATSFGPNVDEAALGEPIATVRFTQSPEDGDSEGGDSEGGDSEGGDSPANGETESILLKLYEPVAGSADHYLVREGNNTGFQVSSYVAGRLQPGIELFQTPEGGEVEPPAPPPQGGLDSLPPEILQQLQGQLQGLGSPP